MNTEIENKIETEIENKTEIDNTENNSKLKLKIKLKLIIVKMTLLIRLCNAALILEIRTVKITTKERKLEH